jgi:digeranylgeranylglycerophospholipid reductase
VGDQVHCRRPFRGARSDAGTWRLEPGDLGCRYLVGADGARSAVARDLGLGVNREFLFGVEAEF